MITIKDQLSVNQSASVVWDLINEFETLAPSVPTLKSYKIDPDGDHAEGKVGVQLGILPVESRVKIEITERQAPSLMRVRGISYLGETIENINKDMGKKSKFDADSVGRFEVVCTLTPDEKGGTLLEYEVNVEAEGKLQRIYESIIKLKLPSMQQEFYDKFTELLAGRDVVVETKVVADTSVWAQLGIMMRLFASELYARLRRFVATPDAAK